MFTTSKPQTLSEMMNSIFRSYTTVFKMLYPLLLTIFIVESIFSYTTSVILVVHCIFDIVIYSACILKTKTLLTNEASNVQTWKEIFLTIRKRILSYIMLLALTAAILMSAMFVAGMLASIPLLFILQTSAITLTNLFEIAMRVGSLAASVIFIYLYFSSYVFWLDNKGVIQSIKESYKLVNGRRWFSIKSLIWFSIVFLAPYFFIILVILFLSMNTSTGVVLSLSYIATIIIALTKIIYYPLFVIAPICLYYNLKLQKI